MKLPPPAKKTTDLEGKADQRWSEAASRQLKGTNRSTAPSREKILARIESELNMVFQYLDDLKDGLRMHPGKGVGTYMAKAEALIELLEVHDCGSVGGFDGKSGLLYLEQRFEALQSKYGPKRIKVKAKRRKAKSRGE
jgi:hypothetical protein